VNWIIEYRALTKSVVSSCRPLHRHSHILEAAETSDQRGPPFLDDLDHAADVRYPAGERRGNGRLRLGQRHANIRGFERPTIVRAVAAKGDGVPQILQPLDQLGFLVG
jgi:hypothetical protein